MLITNPGKCKSKPQDITSHVRMAVIKRPKIARVGEEGEEKEPLYTLVGM